MENDLAEKIIPACIVCDSNQVDYFCDKNNCRLYRCSLCRLVFVNPLPGETASIYSKDYFAGAQKGFGYVDYDTDKQAMEPLFIDYLKQLEFLLSGNKGSILDIGAATGYFLDLARRLGWETFGIEISDYAAEVARQRGLVVKTGVIGEPLFPNNSFEVVTMWDVLEHVRNPRLDLTRAYELLRPGGVLVINTPNSGSLFARLLGRSWHLLVPPEHLHYFTPKSLTLLLEQIGFKVIKVSSRGKIFTLEYIFHTLARWQGLVLWHKILTWFRRHPKIGRLGLPLNLRDNMLVYARKS